MYWDQHQMQTCTTLNMNLRMFSKSGIKMNTIDSN